MIVKLVELWRVYRGRCPGCGVAPDEVGRIVAGQDDPIETCEFCGGPHEIIAPPLVTRCPCCGALLDESEAPYAEIE
jgi:hypothetical protein